MKFCTNCGATLAEGAKFCNKCGAKIAQTEPPQAAPPFTAPPPSFQAPPSYQQPPAYQPAPYQAPPASAGLQPNVAGTLCYIPWVGWIVAIIFLVLNPYNKDRFVRFQAFQEIFLVVAYIVLSVAISALGFLLPWGLTFLLHRVLWLGSLLLGLFMMYKAYNKETYKLPVIGDLARQQAG